MKRKEMIEKMAECFINCSKKGYSIPESMDKVLEICEENDMAPPPDKSTTSPFKGGCICQWEYSGGNHE